MQINSLFRQRAEHECFVPNPLYFARPCPYIRPVIVQPDQVARRLVAATYLTPTLGSPLLPAVTRIAIVLLYNGRVAARRTAAPDATRR